MWYITGTITWWSIRSQSVQSSFPRFSYEAYKNRKFYNIRSKFNFSTCYLMTSSDIFFPKDGSENPSYVSNVRHFVRPSFWIDQNEIMLNAKECPKNPGLSVIYLLHCPEIKTLIPINNSGFYRFSLPICCSCSDVLSTAES